MKKLLSLGVVLFIGVTALTLFGSQDRGGHEGGNGRHAANSVSLRTWRGFRQACRDTPS